MSRKVTLWIGLALCLLATGVWGQSVAERDAESEKLHAQWQNQFWIYLESSEHAQFRTEAAIRLKKTANPIAIERGDQLINEVLSAPVPDPASLWLLAAECQRNETADWCEPGGVYELLIQADPGNAAAILLRFSQPGFDDDESLLDTEAHWQILLEAAEADHFDGYWGRGADKLFEEAFAFVAINPAPPFPVIQDSPLPFDITPTAQVYSLAIGPIIGQPLPGFGNIFKLCKAQAKNQHSEGIKTCKKLASLIWNSGYTIFSKLMGNKIEKAMISVIDPNDPDIRQLQIRGDIFYVSQMCFAPDWRQRLPWNSEAQIMNWARNLSELGEAEGHRLTAFQEYLDSPESFAVNPAECDTLMDLDDEAMEKFMNGQRAVEAWKAMQHEVLEKSRK